MAVGSDIGNVYTGQEGYDKAFILGESDDALQGFQQLLANQAKVDAGKQAMLAAKEKQKVEMKDKLKAEIPEWWHRYDSEMQNHTDKVFKLGAELMAAGIEDPLKSTTSQAQFFQNELARLQQKGKLSIQLKDSWAKDREKINSDSANKYTQQSKDDLVNWYDQSNLEDRLKTGELPPRLMVAEPKFELAKYYGELADNLGKNNKDPKDQDFAGIVNIALNDAANEGFREALASEYEQVKQNPIALNMLEQNAKAAGLSPAQYLGVTQLKSYFGKEPIDVMKAIEPFLPTTRISGSKYEDMQNVTVATDSEYLDPNDLKTAAKAALDMNPKLFTQLQEMGLAKDSDEAIKYVSDLMKSQVQTSYKTATTREKDGGYMGTGYGKEEIDEDFDMWWKAFSGNLGNTKEERLKNRQIATTYLSEVKDENGELITGGRTPASIGTDVGWFGDDEGTPDNFDPNKIELHTTGNETIKYEDNGVEVTGKRPKTNKKMWQFNNPNDPKSFMSATKGNSYYMESLKNVQKRKFIDVLSDEKKGYQEQRNQDAKVNAVIKSNARQSREQGNTNNNNTTTGTGKGKYN